MKKLFICLIFFIQISGPVTFGQMPDSVKTYIDSALYFMQTKSLYANGINWENTRDSAYCKAKSAMTYTEAFPAIVYAFQQLKDFHGMAANADTFYRFPPPSHFEERISPAIKKEYLKGNRFVTASLYNSVGYLRVPSMNVNNQKGIDQLANRLRDSLCTLLGKNPERLIVDLRMNSGGNSAPMISGLGPLFRDSLLGYGVDRDGNFLSSTKLKDGVVTDESGNKMANIETTCVPSQKLRVAVLIGPATVSSAEILAAFLKQLPNVKLFGEPTAGFCNSTEGFLFMNNQGYLLLTVNLVADAKKHVYHNSDVEPTVFIKSADNYESIGDDPTVAAAVRWLEN